jgi:uncharacterized membrane-anchored protein
VPLVAAMRLMLPAGWRVLPLLAWGGGLGVAAAVQAVVTLGVLAVMVGFARRRPSGGR